MIRELRRRRGESIAEFAAFLGIPEYIVSEWDSGVIAPSYWTALLVARIVLDAEKMASLYQSKKNPERLAKLASPWSVDGTGGMNR